MRRALLAAACLLLPSLPARAQSSALSVHHTFPEAGRTLQVVVEGFAPFAHAVVELLDPTAAPPSVVEHLAGLGLPLAPGPDGGLALATRADEHGRLSFAFDLSDEDDASGLLSLSFDDGTQRAVVQLLVHPPLLLLSAEGGIARLDLRSGEVLLPLLSGPGGLRGAALSRDGLSAWILREGGWLQRMSALSWASRGPGRRLADASDDLAHGPATGPAFVLVRPEGDPFAPPGRLIFVDDLRELIVEPLAQPVAGRRWALSDDGLLAFVAEDDLLVREIDLQRGTARGVFSAGFPEDRIVADLAFAGGRLYVATGRPAGPGGLSVLDTRTGWLRLFPLLAEPRRLVVVDGQTVLAIPAAGASVDVLQDGLPANGLDGAAWGAEQVLDAAPVRGGALLLLADGAGLRSLLRWDPLAGASRLIARGAMPDARRIVAAGHDLVVLLGASDGRAHRLDLVTEMVAPVEGLVIAAEAPFVVLP